ncbi:HYR-like domain-containing protein [Flavobacterium algicola]|uniref:HYR-like domain-containing protein n=1 Tax=Flavobacterium algicola TaxID=556529 RepID=UPI001EFD1F7B|nr:PKD-like domain-containing protein [Flavobacterium algicola]MCG9792808.1 gliding motility-associated C-terminal domain-containing protein [Flavobacterium algicola]
MKKKYLLLFCILLASYQHAYSQLSDLHYLPPLKQVTNNQAVRNQAYYLSTPETVPFTVQVFEGANTTPVAALVVSNATPIKYDLADGDNNISLVTNANTGIVLSNSGLRFQATGGQKFYVNYRGRSGAQGTSLTSKGRQALGTDFKWGGIPNRATNNNLTTTLGIMATEDNTTVAISGYNTDCEFRLGNDAGGITANTLNITLNAGQSYVVEALKNQTSANIDGWLGATITSNKKIAISNGGLNVGVRSGAQSRDAAIDQPVPQNIIGKDYVFVRGNGTDETEFPIIIGTQNGTDIFVNGSSTPIATINNGEYFEIPGSNYSSGNIGANMTVVTSKEAYAYQCLAGSSGIQTIGLNFVAPVNCLLPDNLSNIPDIRDVAGLNFTGGITILASISTPDANITVTDGGGTVSLPASIPSSGLPWKSFFVPNLTGNVSVSSTGPIAIGFIGVNNNAGIAGYFSGFDTVPVVDLEITGGGCLPGSDLNETSGTFDAYQWYKDNKIIDGATNQNYTPSSPGDFFVKVTKGGCTYDSAILSAYNCDPEIVLTKTVDKSNVIEGDTVDFKVTVKSLGVNPVNNLVITDLLPAELSFVSATPIRGTWTAPNWTIGQMTSGEVFSITIKAVVNEVSATTTVTNTVSNSQTEIEADAITDDETEDVTITNSGLSVTKEDLPADVGDYDTVDELIIYKIVVTNTGDTVLNNITITDPKADAGSISPTSVATLAIGASTTFTATHKITQANIDAGKVTNQATAKAILSNGYEITAISDDPDNSDSNIDPTITPIIQTGQLLLEKIADPADDGLYDSLGEIINYELVVKNTGNVTLNNVTIVDANANSGSITPATLTSLASGDSYTFTAKHTIVQADFNAGRVSNIATVSGAIPVTGTIISDQSDDPTTLAPNDATVVSVPEVGRLTATKEDVTPSGTILNAVGQVISYEIIVQNTGTITLTDLNIVDPKANTITLQSTTGTDTNTTDNRVDSIDPLQTATFIATHIITQSDLNSGKVTNRATASALDTTPASVTDITDDPNNPNNAIDDPTVTLLASTPSLSIVKTVNDDSNVAVGQILTYTYTVTNNGNVTIDALTINDLHNGDGTLSIPALQSTTGTDDDITDNEIETLAPGQTGVWTATYTVTSSDITNQIDITNTVTATGKPRTDPLTSSTANATKNVTVNPIETICSDAVLAHDLTLDGAYTDATFSWVAIANGDITGTSTSPKTTSTIDDILVNDSGTDHDIQYNITVRNSSNVIIDTYKYFVTVHPRLILPDDDLSKVQCIAQATIPATPIVTDYLGTTITPVVTENTSPICEGDKIYSFEYTDCVGNKYTYTYTYIIDVTSKPVIPVNEAATVECIANTTTPTPPSGITDVCGNAITAALVSIVDSPTSLTCEGTRTYNYTYTDCSGLVSNWNFTYTIDRTTIPAAVPANEASSVECIEDATTPTPPTGITDVCGTAITAVLVSTIDSPSTLTCEGTRTYNYTFTDCSGLVSSWKYTYTIDKTTVPVVPADTVSTVECLADATTPTPPTTVTDVCGTAITAVLISTIDSPSTLTCEGTRTYNYTFTDCSGLVSSWKYTYTIDKTTVPMVPADAISTVECLADATTPTPPATVTDVCGNAIMAVLVSTVDSPSTLTCEGTRTYNYTFTDCSGLVSNWKYIYTIDKTTVPVVPADAGSTVECLADATTPTPPATVTDVCGNAITAVLVSTVDSPSTLTCEGTRTYNYTFTDCSGLVSNWKYTYTIDKTTVPVVPADAISTVECLANATTPTPPATVTDVCGTTITAVLVSTIDSPSTLICEGTRTYNYTFTDCSGLVSNWKYTYTIDKTTVPVVPADAGSIVECLADATTPTPPATVTDICGTAITAVLVSTVDSPSTLTCEGTRTYNYTFTDCSGLVSNWKYTYTIDKTTVPLVPADAISTVECLADATTPTPPATVTDVCGTAITAVLISTIDSPSTLTCEGTRTYNYTFTDCSGLVSNWKYTYTIDKTTVPVVPADAGSTVECLADATTPTPPATVKDVCGTAITAVLVSTIDSPSILTCEGTRTYNYTFTDCSGLVSNWKYIYTIDKTTVPVVPADAGSTVECLADATTPTPPATVTDVCGTAITAVLVSTIDSPSTLTCEGTRTYNYTFTDCSGLVSNWKYIYTIDKTTVPLVPADAGSTVECLTDATTPTPPATVTDVCGNAITAVLVSTVDSPSTLTCEGTRTYNYTFTDCSGLVSNWKYIYTIDKTTVPVVPADAGSTVECLADATMPIPPTTVTDVCGTAITAVLASTIDSPSTLTCEGTKTYNYTFTDCSVLISSWKYIYTIDKTTVPVVPADAISTVECLADATTPTPPATVTDVCGTAITAVLVSTVDSPSSLTCEGTRTYNYTFTDCSGLVSNWKYTYTIDKTTVPLVPADAGSTVECLADATRPTPPATVTDVCGTAITAVLVSTIDSPSTLSCEGTRTYNYTFTDCSGLVSNWKYIYTIDKTTVPVVPADAGSTVECLANATTPTPPATVTDVCGTAITAVLISTIDSPSTLTCEGTRTYNYTFTDCSGLVSNWKYIYTIDKTTVPVVPADAGSTVHDISEAVQPTAPVVTDKCGNNIVPVITQNVSPICDGSKIYTFTYTDCAGNSTAYNYTYIIDVTSTLAISNKVRTSCSSIGLNYDLRTVTTLVNPTFQWTTVDNPNVSGENNNTGTLLNDILVNKTGIPQNVRYTVIPFNNKGCQGPSFEILVTVNPEPYVAIAPTAVSCSNIPLNHDLNADVNVTGATFKWVAISNPNVSGATTTVSTSETITDNLINTSGIVQTIVYKITPESIKGCVGTVYNYTVTVRPEANLIVTKSTTAATDGAYDSLGEVIKYEITVENPHELVLTSLTLTDANADANSINPLTVPTVAAFAKVTFTASHTITQTDLDAGFVDNSATVNAFDPCGTAVTDDSDDPNTAAENDVTRTVLIQKPSIALEKTFQFNDENGDGIVQNNETVTYRFKVINTGNVNLTAIQITDPLITVNGGPINLGPTATDATTFFGTYTLNQSVIDSESLTNSATVEGVDPQGNIVSDISDDPNDAANTDSNGDGNPDDSTVFSIVSNPELTLKKSGVFIDANGDGLAQAGEKIEYTFDISNTGNVTMTGITVSDPLTAVIGGPIVLIPGQTNSSTFTAIYTLSQADVNNGTVVNTATASGKSPNGSTITDASDDPFTVADNDATVTKLTQDAQITLLKTAVFKDQNGNGFPEVGETIEYIFNVKNVGNVTVTGVKITDPLLNVTGGPISLTPKQFDATTLKGSYTLTLNDINSGSVTNSATAEGKDPKGATVSALSDDPNNPTNVDANNDGHPDDKTVTKLVANPKLSVSKTGVFNDSNNDGLTQVGETILYTFELKNIGNVTVSDINITDALVAVNGGPITLNPNQNDSATFTALYIIKQNDIDAGKVTNTAIASGLSPKGIVVTDTSDDPNNGTNLDTNGNGEPDDATVTVIPGKGKISLDKVTLAPADGAYDTVGEKINYQLTITNTGNLTLTNVIVTDVNADNGSVLPAVITSITPGATATVTAQHTLTLTEINSGSVTNSASVNAKDPFGNTITDISDDPNNGTNSDSNGDGDPDDATITLISQKPSISIEKTFSFNDENKDGFPQLNETITYNFKVTNTGNVNLSNITVTDALTPVLGGPIALAPKQINTNTFYATYKITQANIDAGSIVNSATVNAKDPNGGNVTDTSDDPNNSTNSDVNGDGEPDDATVTTLISNPQLTITKKGTFIDANGDGLAQAGETIKYHFDVTNSGNVTISDIAVDDALVPVTGGPITLAPKSKNTTTFQAIYVLTQDDVNTGFVINSATAIGQDPFGNTITDKSDDPTTTAHNDDTNTSLARESQLSLFKIATFNDENGDGIPQANETISYIFDIRNDGNVTIFNIVITDPLVSVNGAPIDLAPAQIDNTNFSAVYTIKQSDIDSGAITNSALAIGQDRDGTIVTDVSDYSDDPDNPDDIDLNGDGDPDDPTVSSLTGKASLDLTKKGTFNDLNANGFADIDETITYAFEVSNTGNLSIKNITILDPLVTVTGTAIDLVPNQKDSTTFTAIYKITQADLDAGKISNSATVSGQDPTGNTVKDVSDDPINATNVDSNNDGNPDDVTVTTFPVQGRISIIKSARAAADGAYDTIGEKINYNIVVTNTGSTTLSTVSITDTNADVGSIMPKTVTLLAPGQSVNVSATHTITQVDLNIGTVSNSASVSSKDKLGNTVFDLSDDPNNPANIDANADGDPDDTTVTSMIQKPKMALTKTASLAPDGLWDEVGEVILYNLVLTNTGNVTLTNVVISDANADAASITPATILKLEPGQKATIKAQHTITQNDLDSGAVSNSATASAIDPKGNAVSDLSDDPNNLANVDTNGNGNPDDVTITKIPQTATMDVAKVTTTPTFTNPGDIMKYTIKVTNTGTVTLLNIIIKDANATFTSPATKGSLNPGQSFTITAQHLITADDVLFGFVDNSAIATALIPFSNVVVSEDSDDPNNNFNVDKDNDGDFEDPTTSYLDTDSDGIADIVDIDDDNDGIIDTVETNNDSDGDGIPNSLDIDADNDGIPDNVEGQSTNNYKAPTGIDVNRNGLDDIYETATSTGIIPENTDGTDNPDYLDDDSDNDGITDTIEAFDKNHDGIPDLFASGNDADHDGLDDSFEGSNKTDGFVVNNELKNGSKDTNNTDQTDQPDYRDTDDDNDGVFTIFEIDSNKDGSGPDDTDRDGIPDYLDIDDDGDGLSTRKEGADPNGDGNPSDAIDANANGIPDYLEVGNHNLNIPDDEIEVYNGITPNGDGENDVLVLGRIFEFPENTVEIYNRWGVLVYETSGYGTRDNYFRGYSEGRVTISQKEKLPGGTYFYVIKYKSGSNLKQKAGYLFLQQ